MKRVGLIYKHGEYEARILHVDNVLKSYRCRIFQDGALIEKENFVTLEEAERFVNGVMEQQNKERKASELLYNLAESFKENQKKVISCRLETCNDCKKLHLSYEEE